MGRGTSATGVEQSNSVGAEEEEFRVKRCVFFSLFFVHVCMYLGIRSMYFATLLTQLATALGGASAHY